MRIVYRMRQFWRMVFAKDHPYELEQVQELLNPQQMELFLQMEPGEKDHAVRIYHRLIEQGDKQPDLLVAALLHDVGKVRHHLDPLERTMVVLGKAIMPSQAHRWGELPSNTWDSVPGWQKPFVVSEQHAGWGAEMARQAGVSLMTETLIREHHNPNFRAASDEMVDLLHKLRVVDNVS